MEKILFWVYFVFAVSISLYFFSIFYSTYPFVVLLSFLIIILAVWFVWKKKKKLAIPFFVLLICIVILSAFHVSRETYCEYYATWKVGSSNETFTDLSENEKRILGKGVTNISKWFREHLQCDSSFRF